MDDAKTGKRPVASRWTLTRFVVLFLVALIAASGISFLLPASAQQQARKRQRKASVVGTPPKDYQQLLPRGGIPAINDPTYVSAEKAKIADDAMVLGVVIEGKPIAYSLNLLNRHEIVNDTVGDTNFAAVW